MFFRIRGTIMSDFDVPKIDYINWVEDNEFKNVGSRANPIKEI